MLNPAVSFSSNLNRSRMGILMISEKHSIEFFISKFYTNIKDIFTNSLIEFKNIKSQIFLQSYCVLKKLHNT